MLGARLLIVLILVSLIGCGGGTTQESTTVDATTGGGRYSEADPAFKLASLDLGHVATRDEEVEPYARSLELLHTRCEAELERLPDMVVTGQQKLAENGISYSILELLQALAEHGPRENTSADCADYIAGTVFVLISEAE